MEVQEKIKNVLTFWYKLEFFSPIPPKTKSTFNKQQIMPWEKNKEYNETFTTIYNIYLGRILVEDSLDKLRTVINRCEEKIDIDNNESIVCGLKLDENGFFIPGTFAISRYCYAVNEIIKSKNIDIKLDETIIKDIENKLSNKIQVEEPYSKESLLELLETINNLAFPELKELIKIEGRLTLRRKRRKDSSEETADLLSSFYVSDLDMLIKKPLDEKIVKLLDVENPNQNRVEIDIDKDEIVKITNPKYYPLGKWPSKYRSALMQQIAINLSLEGKQDIYSVNGPPGSGKTTLLKEIIAGLIVKRAKVLATYNNPNDAFKELKVECGQNQYFSKCYVLDKNIIDFGMLVASNNNGAVENLTLELPKASDVKTDNVGSDLFDIDIHDDIYFTELAKNLKGEDNWGLISARLGKRPNIKEFVKATGFKVDDKKTFDSYTKSPKNFRTAKENFLKKLTEVETYQQKLINSYNNLLRIYPLEKDIAKLEIDFQNSKEEYLKQENIYEDLKETKNKLEKSLAECISDYNKLNSIIPWYKKIFSIFFKKNKAVLKLKELTLKQENIYVEIIEIKEKINHQEEVLIPFQEQKDLLETTLKDNKKELQKNKNKIEEDKKQFVVPDEEYLDRISENKKSQETSPWTNDEYDKLRIELFFESLNLHQAFTTSSSYFAHNFRCIIDIFNNNCSYREKQQTYKHLLNNLFLLVPVISTTFASVSRFLECIDKDEISYLFIDEAGQGTPVSTMGAIYRSKKCIIIGDPFQIEPVVSIPKEFYERFSKLHPVDSKFKIKELSIQNLADEINKYGAVRNNSATGWIGTPLLIHRRCLNPMFNISNEIAYENKMIYSTKEIKEKELDEKDLVLENVWLDIKGTEVGDANHYVKEQGNKVIQILNEKLNLTNNEFPKIYIISPYLSVSNQMRIEIRKLLTKRRIPKEDIISWSEKICGTVHTFQGKETDEVILLLGCDEACPKSAEWAGKKPNILNVAVTRAKYKLTIIGDRNLWKNVNNFDIVIKYFNN